MVENVEKPVQRQPDPLNLQHGVKRVKVDGLSHTTAVLM
jgi:hypothetical protein